VASTYHKSIADDYIQFGLDLESTGLFNDGGGFESLNTSQQMENAGHRPVSTVSHNVGGIGNGNGNEAFNRSVLASSMLLLSSSGTSIQGEGAHKVGMPKGLALGQRPDSNSSMGHN
jgi:hypothetical protein